MVMGCRNSLSPEIVTFPETAFSGRIANARFWSLNARPITMIAAGSRHTIASDMWGALYGWGSNEVSMMATNDPMGSLFLGLKFMFQYCLGN
jgi:hypothetical protein